MWIPATPCTTAITWAASNRRDVNNSGEQEDIKLYIFGKFLQTNVAVNFSTELRFFAKLYEEQGLQGILSITGKISSLQNSQLQL